MMTNSQISYSETTERLLSSEVSTELQAFGSKVTLQVSGDNIENTKKTRDVHDIYEPFLASRVIPQTGVCVDLGAAEGWFAIPFASTFSNWTVVCFESNPNAITRLKANIKKAKLKNIVVVEASLHPQAPSLSAPKRMVGSSDLPRDLLRALKTPTEMAFELPLALAPRPVPVEDTKEGSQLPAFSAEVLDLISPDLVKIDAPGCEASIAKALQDTPVGFLVGKLWSHTSSDLFQPSSIAGNREFYLTYGQYALRRDYEDNFSNRKPGLDVVVAMYNAKQYIVECIESVLADGNPEVRVIVVDDGSNDGCDKLVIEHFETNPRVELVQKFNGGCASARNFGRQVSNASHIAFIDADDRVDSGMFSALLELARYTGASVVESEFAFLQRDKYGEEILSASHEATEYPPYGNAQVGPYGFQRIAGHRIAIGQPTIWRRVHRRDFLDRNNIWFPEHIRAFDDQIFQLLVAQYCGMVPHLYGFSYHYRQHPDQDIKQGDERHFYSFNMFRKIFHRAIDENWKNINPAIKSLLNTMHWSYSGLRDDLKPIYRKAAVEFLAMTHMTFGYQFAPIELNRVGIESLELLLKQRLSTLKGKPINYAYMRSENWMWQPEFIRMMLSNNVSSAKQ